MLVVKTKYSAVDFSQKYKGSLVFSTPTESLEPNALRVIILLRLKMNIHFNDVVAVGEGK